MVKKIDFENTCYEPVTEPSNERVEQEVEEVRKIVAQENYFDSSSESDIDGKKIFLTYI